MKVREETGESYAGRKEVRRTHDRRVSAGNLCLRKDSDIAETIGPFGLVSNREAVAHPYPVSVDLPRGRKMAFPRKFKELLESGLSDVEKPDYAWLTYAVCGCSADACGWAGWVIEAAFRRTEKHFPTGTGDKALQAIGSSACPRCGKELFRTAASIRFEPSEDQTPVHGVPGVDYDVEPMEYE